MTALWVVYLPLLLAYGPPLLWCWDLWWVDESYFAHGPLVPIVMGAVIWSRRAQWRLVPAGLDRGGGWLLLPALLLHLVGAALTIDSLSAASLALAVPGGAWLALGRQRLRGLWPALWLFALAIPLPIYVTGQLAFELKEIAVRGGVGLAQLTGLAVVRDGPRLSVPGQEAFLDVADPCGGLRSLLAMIALAYCLAFFLGPAQLRRRLVLLAMAAPVALAVNLLRIAAICWLARWWGVPFATGTGHDLMNGAAWVVDLLLLLGIDSLCTGRAVTLPAPAPLPADSRPLAPPTSLRPGVAGAVLWPGAVLLLWLCVHRPYTESSGRARSLPAVLGAFERVYDMPPDDPMTRRFHALLGTDDVAWRTYQTSDQQQAFVVAVFHGTNWKSVHPPRICLLGSNMEMLEDGDTEFEGGGRIGRLLLKTRKDQRPYLSLYAYGARDLLTGSYLSFFLHHAPRALFRQSNDGFLLRVEAFADGPGGLPAAERRCRELLALLLVQARNRLP